MNKEEKFLRKISDNTNTHTPRARRRKMERELKKLNVWKNNENKSGSTESTDKTSWHQASHMPHNVTQTHFWSTRLMSENEIMHWMEEFLSETGAELSALGMIRADIEEFGFESWLDLSSEFVIDSYYEVTEAVVDQVCDRFQFLFEEQTMLKEADISPEHTFDPVEAMYGVKEGFMGTFASMRHYVETQRLAKESYKKND